jgi:ribonuclease J
MVRLFPETTHFPGEVRTGELYLDGNILCTPDESGVKGRRRLMFGGHIVVSVAVDNRGMLVGAVQMAIEGLPEVEEDDESIADLVRRTINGTLKSIPPKRRGDLDLVNSALQRAVRSEVANYWGKKPNVAVFVHGV